MKGLALFLVLAFSHVLMLVGPGVPVSGWTLAAYLWQDALVALVFSLVAWALGRRPGLVWGIYSALVLWAALNVPVTWVLSSPLTLSMLRAARGTLWDSIRYSFTVANVAGLFIVVGVGAALGVGTSVLRMGKRTGTSLAGLGILLVAIGPYADSRIATGGRHRNAFGALWPTGGPALPVSGVPDAGADEDDLRQSPFGSGLSGPELAGLRGAGAGRNVVVVILESAGARYLAPYGSDSDPMPYFSALARSGILFERAYAVYPESVKGLLPFLCSIYPSFGVAAEAYGDVDCPSIAGELGAAGYRTGLFHSGRFQYLGMRSIVEGRGYEVLADAGDISGNMRSSFGVDEPAAISAIFDWVDALSEQERFFLTYLPVAGHHPYATPEPGPFVGDTEQVRYLNALHYADRALGALLDGLASRGLYDDTIFLVFGDHGEAFGDHGGNYGHSFFVYETNVRVPYLVALPGILTETVATPNPLSLIDTAPTLLDLLGLPVPQTYLGASALDGRSRMAYFFADNELGWLGLYDACWKYILEIDSGRSQLYDVCTDPGELRDLAADETARVNGYRERAESWAALRIASRPEDLD